jgi:outer membrane protein assembly factor BamD (BamD/ComL family)
MSPHRITKKEIKQDKFVTYALKTSEWVQKHLNQVLAVAGGVIVVVAVVIFVISSQAKRERKAAELLGKANFELQTGDIAAAVADLQTVVNSYGGSKSAGQASFLLASAYFYAKDYVQAQSMFEKYLNDYGEDPLMASSSQAGIADCHLQKGNFAEAGESFAKAASLHPTGFLSPQYLLKAADAYIRADEKIRAKELLNRLITDYPESRETRQAKMRLAELS